MQNPRQETRADLLFATYVEMGESRTLLTLSERLGALGVPISLPTLKRYSARYDWQARAAEVDREVALRRQDTAIGQVVTMLDRHVQLGRALQGAAGSGLQKLLSNDGRLGEMKAGEIARLLEIGIKAERQAFVESSDRKDIALTLSNLITRNVVSLFLDINKESESERRARLFAAGLDHLIGQYLKEGESA